MEKKFVSYKGARVIEGWPEKIAAAQVERNCVIKGTVYPRIPFGDMRDGYPVADDEHCRDCAAMKGELHVPGCDVERCPACGGQAISCGCLDDAHAT